MEQSKLNEILKSHKKWLAGEAGERADLRGADLRGADLSGADLREADLRWADLRWANLREADLSGADLRGADLSGADLSEADLRWANLREADLRGADLSGADLSEADLRGADLRWADLRGAVGQVFITQRSDGYQFFAVYDKGVWMIRAGCRYWDIETFREHTNSYDCDKKRSETRLILDYAELVIADRGVVPEGE
ncbi:pentapeptide repeat-containing protein [Zhongshania sp.]|uniref:pentapeptide repeat-containing protein n=1 Tax=Zhongshania sp. TaxID=1971902 RepID=UPI00356815A0